VLIVLFRKTKIAQIVLTCLQYLWTVSFYLAGQYCRAVLTDLPTEHVTAPSLHVLAYATLCYALALVLLFADQPIARYFGWDEARDKRGPTDFDWSTFRQELEQQFKKKR
jgi:hypothetical protein